jgi:hypothetical protein
MQKSFNVDAKVFKNDDLANFLEFVSKLATSERILKCTSFRQRALEEKQP